MSKSKIYCEDCSKVIDSKDDLVTTTVVFRLVPYCKDCYVDQIKGMTTIIVSNTPINGTYSNFFTVLALIIFIPLMFIPDPVKILFLVGLFIFLAYRLDSYLRFERYVE